MIDNEGFRANVGIILCNRDRKLFWGHRIGHLDSWQFPQGGIDVNESPEEAMYRELNEEIGLLPEHVRILGRTKNWLRYRLPQRLIRRNNARRCIGQKQIWFLLELVGDESALNLGLFDTPEFDRWRWIDYWHPADEVIYFKRQVYARALAELAPILFKDEIPPREARPPAEKGVKNAPAKGRRSLYRMSFLGPKKNKRYRNKEQK